MNMGVEHNGVTFERLDHASVRIETEDGTVIYIDPWKEVFNGDPADGDIVFVTHDDFDHYDPDAIEAIPGPTGPSSPTRRLIRPVSPTP